MKFSGRDVISYVAIFVIVVSLASIGMKFTGYDTVDDTARINVTVVTSAAINFTADFIEFGVGSVTEGQAGATMDTEGSAVPTGSWTSPATGLVLENIGNVNVSLGLQASDLAQDYLGGTGPLFQYMVSNSSGDTGSCNGNTAPSYTNFTTGNVEVCAELGTDAGQDEVDIDIKLYIPSDSFTGNLTATITATGTYS